MIFSDPSSCHGFRITLLSDFRERAIISGPAADDRGHLRTN